MMFRAKGFVAATRLIVQGISGDTMVNGARAIVSGSTGALRGLVNTSDVQPQCEDRCSYAGKAIGRGVVQQLGITDAHILGEIAK